MGDNVKIIRVIRIPKTIQHFSSIQDCLQHKEEYRDIPVEFNALDTQWETHPKPTYNVVGNFRGHHFV